MPSASAKPNAKSSRSSGAAIITANGSPLQAKATGTAAANMSRVSVTRPWRRRRTCFSVAPGKGSCWGYASVLWAAELLQHELGSALGRERGGQDVDITG